MTWKKCSQCKAAFDGGMWDNSCPACRRQSPLLSAQESTAAAARAAAYAAADAAGAMREVAQAAHVGAAAQVVQAQIAAQSRQDEIERQRRHEQAGDVLLEAGLAIRKVIRDAEAGGDLAFARLQLRVIQLRTEWMEPKHVDAAQRRDLLELRDQIARLREQLVSRLGELDGHLREWVARRSEQLHLRSLVQAATLRLIEGRRRRGTPVAAIPASSNEALEHAQAAFDLIDTYRRALPPACAPAQFRGPVLSQSRVLSRLESDAANARREIRSPPGTVLAIVGHAVPPAAAPLLSALAFLQLMLALSSWLFLLGTFAAGAAAIAGWISSSREQTWTATVGRHELHVRQCWAALIDECTDLDAVARAWALFEAFDADPRCGAFLGAMTARHSACVEIVDQLANRTGAGSGNAAAPKASFLVGTRVRASWRDGRYYPGIITQIHGDRYLVAWDDGDASMWLTVDQLQPC